MNSVAWRDLLFNLLGSLLLALVLVLLLINDPQEESDSKVRDVLIVDLYWQDPYRNHDVDLWVSGPADAWPVGYSHKTGTQFSLIRDITSKRMSLAPINHEQAGAQALIDGRYTVNVHLYRASNGALPVPVTVVVSVMNKDVLSKTVELLFVGQEITVFNFTLTDGVISNVGDFQRSLRSASKP